MIINLFVSLMILAVMFLITIIGLKRINKVDVEQRPRYTLKLVKLEKQSLWERKVKSITVATIFSLICITGLFCLIISDFSEKGFSEMYTMFSFFGLGVTTLGTMWNHNYVPNINMKYQIIEDKEN